MDNDTAKHLLNAFRECRQFTPEQLKIAEELLANPDQSSNLADELQKADLVTPYMFRKIKANRTFEILFGPYLILDKIGEGGMGKVYRAVQFPAGRMVALKVVRQHLMNNTTVKRRYQKEAAAAAALDHPNIVKLYDADEINGRYYLAMEFVDGIDLARLLKEFGTPPQVGLPAYQEAVEYVRQAALGLQHAHDKGLVHRDIKPSNLLVYGSRALPGTRGEAIVKVLDMGLVRSIIEEDEQNTELTRDGTVVGTPDYMSPEQAKNSSTVDARADQYSLGCTLYYLLRGQPPYPDGSPIDKLLRHQLDPAPDLHKERKDLPSRLCEIVAKLMAKKPSDRYPNIAAVADALAPFTALHPPEPEPFSFAIEASSSTVASTILNEANQPIPEGRTTVLPTPATTTSPPAVKLRVVQPKPAATTDTPSTPTTSTEQKKRPAKEARAATPIAIPKPTGDSSSDSLPGTDVKQTPRRIVKKNGATPSRSLQETNPKTPRELPRKRPALAVKPTQNEGMKWIIVAVVVVVSVLFLIIVAWLIFRGSTVETVSTTTTPPKVSPNQEPKADNPPEPIPVGTAVLAWNDRLPDQTAALLVMHPEAFFKALDFTAQNNGQIEAQCRELNKNTKFNPRSCQRAVIAFTEPKGEAVALVEGPFLTPPWIDSLSNLPNVTKQEVGTDTLFNFPSTHGPKRGMVLTNTVFALSSSLEPLKQLSLRLQQKRPPRDIEPTLLAPFTRTKPTPFLHFQAGSKFALPEGETFQQLGIREVSLIVTLEGTEFQFQFEVTAATKSKLDDFISLMLTTKLAESYPATKPFLNLLSHAEVTETNTSGIMRYRASARMPWSTAIEAAEKLLPKLD